MANPVEDDVVELRFNVPRWIAEVIDAHVAAKRLPRTAVATGWITDRARSELHLAMMMSRTTRGNGNVPPSEHPSGWGDLGN